MRKKYWLLVSCLAASSIAACSDDDDGDGFGIAGSATAAGAGGKSTTGGSLATAGKDSGGSSVSGGVGGSSTGGKGTAGNGGSAGSVTTAGSGGAPVAGSSAGGDSAGGMGNAGEAGAAPGAAGQAGASEGGAPAVEPSPLCDRSLWKYSFQFCPHGFNGSENQPTMAVDGDAATYVTSGAGQDGTFFALFDLHGSVDVTKLTLSYGNGEKAGDAAATLKVQGSDDGVTFTDLTGEVSGALVNNQLEIPIAGGVRKRFIKLLQLGTSGSWWAIPELDIACGGGTAATPPADAGVATDRTQWKILTPNSACPATGPVGNMVDADAVDSAWQSVGRPGVGYWIHVDLGTTAALKGVHLKHKPGDFPPSVKVQVSSDDVSFQDAASGVVGAVDLDIVFAATHDARFIRIISEADTAGAWWSVADLNIDL